MINKIESMLKVIAMSFCEGVVQLLKAIIDDKDELQYEKNARSISLDPNSRDRGLTQTRIEFGNDHYKFLKKLKINLQFYFSKYTFFIMIGSSGLSRSSIFTDAISSITSIPSTTCPNAAYLPSR